MNNQNQNQSNNSPTRRPNYGSGILPPDLVEKMIRDIKVRVAAVTKSFYLFFHFYFAHYVTFPTAEVQKQIFRLVEKSDKEDLFLVAFRGSGKSTIMTTVYPIWAILGEQQKKFIVIICQTRNQVRQQMANLKAELENNELLKNDLGPFEEESDEWGLYSMVFKKSDARILGASTEQAIRGIRHRQWRPDLIILDDVEDINSTKTQDSRDRLEQWFRGDIVPLGDKHTRIVVVGNLLHEDSLMMRIRRHVESGRDGIFRMIPLLDENGNIAWPGKYPTQEAIENERGRHGHITFEREFNLKIIPAEDQVVPFEWIKTYDVLPRDRQPTKIIISVDLAISDKTTADHTAITTGIIYGYGKNADVYFLPHPVDEKLDFPTTIERIKRIYQEAKELHSLVEVVVEDVGYQRAVVQTLERENLPVKGLKVTDDKRARLTTVSGLIKNGQVLFPAKGGEVQIQQITRFGVERYDDLVDATTMVLLEVLNTRKGATVTKETILRMATNKSPDYKDKIIVGVDVGEKLSYVVGNNNGLLGYGVMETYEADDALGSKLTESLEYYLKNFDSIMVINQRRDIVNSELLRSKYPSRVFFCRYVSGGTMTDPFRWGKGDDYRIVFTDRNAAIRLILGEFEKGLIKLYRKNENDNWGGYWLHWSHLIEVKEKDKYGSEQFIWDRYDCDDFVNATIAWRAKASHFGQRGAVFFPSPAIPAGRRSYMVNPDLTVQFNPDEMFAHDPFDASASVVTALANKDEDPWWARDAYED